jgi:hypothetical protein
MEPVTLRWPILLVVGGNYFLFVAALAEFVAWVGTACAAAGWEAGTFTR